MTNIREWIEVWLNRVSPAMLEIRPLNLAYIPAKPLFSVDAQEIEQYIAKHQGFHLFFGVLGRNHKKGEKESVNQAHCLWVDIDFKDLEHGQNEADYILSGFDIQPSLLIHSGGGYHAYWFLKHPEVDITRVERVLKGLAIRLKGDTQAAEVARILRVPFSRNWKYSPERQVTIVDYNDNEFDFEEFLEWEVKDKQPLPDETRDWFQEGNRDKDLHYVGCRLWEGGAKKDAIEDVLTRLVNSWGEHDPKWVATKVKASMKTITKDQGSIEQKIRDYCYKTTGQFSLGGMTSWMGMQGEDKQQAAHVLTKMEQENDIIRVGNKHGVYRLVDKDPCVMNLDTPDQDPADIELPLGLHGIALLYPKNVLIVAGEKDAGKTAFALNSAYMNRDKMQVTYFNSEMGIEELKSRLGKFSHPMAEWKKIKWIEKASRFEDLIDADGFNIIDFLEIGAEAFTVTEDIKKVFDKLNKGLLLIVMQKRSYKEFAVGGEGTLEKARLAVNLEHRPIVGNVCKITVAKNWTGIINNPRGWERQYKVIQGGRMEKSGEWMKPDDNNGVSQKERGFYRK